MITGADVATYLARRLGTLAALTKQSALDESADGFGEDIDTALARMGQTDITTLEGVDELAVKHLAEFYALYRYAGILSTRVDLDAYAIDDERGGVFDNVETLMNKAAEQAAIYGYAVTLSGPTDTGVGTLGPVAGPWENDSIKTNWIGDDVA
jgi:hypothetical protein